MRFDDAFRSLTGFSPMKWQRRMFERLVKNKVPISCDIPTGLGKTSMIPLWLLALIQQAEAENVRLPRRLIYIVDRRTVVDQATETVEQMRRRLVQPEHAEWESHAVTLREIAAILRGLCATDGVPLAVSTLRGELADNEEWKADPARPAIVVGTIDMIGSKLLFSGYGDGRYGRAHHAGLVGHDALIVHDEAHLTPAFSDLLRAIAQEQSREAKRSPDSQMITRPVRVVELSATSRVSESAAFTLHPEDEEDPVVQKRVSADKRLHLHPAPNDSLVARIVELSKTHVTASAKILIYIRSPEQAQQVAAALEKSLETSNDERIALLTGTIRGHERDQLVQTNPVYRALLDPEYRVDYTVYLVSTSAGEVGIDLDADHLICDVTTLDALIQRFGRVNRRGGTTRQAQVHVIGDGPTKDKSSAVAQAIATTLGLLRDWDKASEDGVDVSPGNLQKLLADASQRRIAAAFSPRSEAPQLTDILLDAWSLTSIERMSGRPPVARFLHGLPDDPPETFVVWRQEIQILAEAKVDDATVGDWFRSCRVEARERLHDRTDRVKKVLERLLKSHRKRNEGVDFPLVLLDERGRARWSELSLIVEKDFDLDYHTVLLPLEAGGLHRNGMMSVDNAEPSDTLDVAEETGSDDRRERWLHRRSRDGDQYQRLITGETSDAFAPHLREKERVFLKQPEEGEIDTETLDLVLLVSPRGSALDNPETTSARQTLAAHARTTVEHMTSIIQRLLLPDSIKAALVTAADWHDRGKDRPVWQHYARNEDGSEPVAKSARYLHPRALGGYRHEFGSLLEAMADGRCPESEERDLMLHLVGAHHGWSRPHFEPRAYDHVRTSAENDQAVSEAMRRFDQLQQRFGRWGLAWLESLLRCADIAASQEAVGSPPSRRLREVEP